MRGQHDVGQPRQGVVGEVGRLGHADVERRDGDPAVPQCLGKGVLVDVAAAGDVDDDEARLDPGQHLARDERRGARRVGGADTMASAWRTARPGRPAAVGVDRGRDERVVGDRPEPERAGLGGDQPADPSGARDAQRLAPEAAERAGQRPVVVRPAAGRGRRRERQDPSLGGEEEGDGVVRDLVRAVVGDVADRDAGRLGRRPVHLVHPDAVAEDADGALEAGDAIGVELAVAGDDDGVRGPDRVVGLGGVPGHDEVHAPAPEDRGLGPPRRRSRDGVEDHDPGAGAGLAAGRGRGTLGHRISVAVGMYIVDNLGSETGTRQGSPDGVMGRSDRRNKR